MTADQSSTTSNQQPGTGNSSAEESFHVPAPMFQNLAAILFDLDGTLIETDNRWARIAAEKLAPLQCVIPRLDPVALGRKLVMASEAPVNYLMSFLEHLGLGSGFFGLTDLVRRSRGVATRDSAVLVQGTLELLGTLWKQYKMAVVTTRARPEARSFIERAGLQHYLPVVVTRQDVVCMKPNPEPVHKAASWLGVAAERCLMVGDTAMDVYAARRAGAYAVGVLSGFGERRELEQAGAHLVLDYAAQLLDYLPLPGQASEAESEVSATTVES